jgi:hypothetical protein
MMCVGSDCSIAQPLRAEMNADIDVQTCKLGTRAGQELHERGAECEGRIQIDPR